MIWGVGACNPTLGAYR